MTTWLTSDLHFGHARIVELSGRPFSSVEEMNRKLIDNWNDSVQSDDLVWVLGDACMGQIDETLPLCAKLRGTKVLISGNHDRTWAGWRRPGKHDWLQRYKDEGGFSLIYTGAKTQRIELTSANGAAFARMSHFPFSGDHTAEERFPEWRPEDNGEWLCHGHVHEEWQVRGRQINVGVDVWDFRPVRESVLADIILGYGVDTQ